MIEVLILSVLCGLITWRIASLLHTEDVFEWLREWIGIENDKQGYPAIYPATFLGDLFHCFFCLATVVALPIIVSLIWWTEVGWAWAFPVWMAASTVAIWTEKQILRSRSR